MNQTAEQPRIIKTRTMPVRPADLVDAQTECRRLGVKQSDFLGVLLRAWKSIDPKKQLAFIPKEPYSA